MNAWLVIILNAVVVLTWGYLLYLVFTIDPEVQAEWKGTIPSWAPNYKNMILSVKITGFINGIIAFISLMSAIYKVLTPEMMGGRRR